MPFPFQPTWEVTTSLRFIPEGLNILEEALSDNIKEEAILAIEAVGNSLVISPNRFYEGRVACQEESVMARLHRAAIIIGVSKQGLRAAMQRSSGLVQFFVLCTSLRICFDDAALGELTTEMLSLLNLKSNFAAKDYDIFESIETFCAHSESLIPL